MTRFQRAFMIWFVFVIACFGIANVCPHQIGKGITGLGLPFAYVTWPGWAVRDLAIAIIALVGNAVIGVTAAAFIATAMTIYRVVQYPEGQAAPASNMPASVLRTQ
jgi:hypothetical protein